MVCISSTIFLSAVRCRTSYSTMQRSLLLLTSTLGSVGEKATVLILSAPHANE